MARVSMLAFQQRETNPRSMLNMLSTLHSILVEVSGDR